ncbi:Do family serine endopeptidase [Thiospirochaeta perfilievii]|uniref:Do family serine endopeptidase n=1 Tax=Thiospirochaeta perfilievii TaxID=252967 RepID=A0A5C1QDU3_9SPIO|nr:Do family serine endopeptidase [Thiospirochaeta perfilievii]QEN05538.1 Do family serine endopeptidase [Thiospirochaeta perfilievii]
MIQSSKKILIILLGCISALAFASNASDNPFRKVAKDVIPVVVQIDTVTKTKVKTGQNPFDFFFKNQDGSENETPQYREFESRGLGSGIVVESRGNKKYVLTNSHVIKDANKLSIHFSNGRSYDAEIVGEDKRRDLGLIVFETKDDIPIAKLGDSDDLYIGDWAIAIGSPLGYESSVTLGIISAVGRPSVTGMEADFTDYIQTDAAINQGNSGGALVNIDGEIIGINTWIASGSGGNIGLGFSIPINNAKPVIKALIEKGSVEYGWLGVSMGNIPNDISQDLRDKDLKGAFVHSLFKDSPADKGGLKPGDIITRVNGRVIKDSEDLLSSVGNLPAGEAANFELVRDNKNLQLKIFPELRDTKSLKSLLWPGINVVNLTKEIVDSINEHYNSNLRTSTKGVIVISVANDSIAKLTGVLPGDIITNVEGNNIKNVTEFFNEISTADSEVSFSVIRNNQKIKLILSNE